jgi:magnesium transporter
MKKYKKAPTHAARRKAYKKIAGMAPGSLVRTGEKKMDKPLITLISYSEKSYEERAIGLEDIPAPDGDPSSVQWINVEGLDDVDVLEQIGNRFGLHRLVLEDILSTDQRPKIEDYGSYTYVVVKVLTRDEARNELVTEQESLILGDGCVLSFAERDTDLFNPLINRLKNDVGRIRRTGADYLFYSLLDVIVDNYFVVLEDLGEGIEIAEDELVSNPTAGTLQEIHVLKRQMLYLHKAVWPFREIIGSLERGDIPWMKQSTEVYLRDLYDHVIQVMDNADTQRDILSSMLDIYLSSVSNRMNGIMKVLTIISTVFMPLTFLVGVYGMNLIIPETRMPWFYPVLWVAMAGIAVTMMAFFKRKKWW